MAEVADHLPSVWEILGPIPCITKQKIVYVLKFYFPHGSRTNFSNCWGINFLLCSIFGFPDTKDISSPKFYF
jgi:hypothetical protein